MLQEISSEALAASVRKPRRTTAGKLTGPKPALKMKEVWSIRVRLELRKRVRDLALFNLAIDSCDLIRLKVEDVAAAREVKNRGIIIQKKTGRPVQFEITEQTSVAVAVLIAQHGLEAPRTSQADWRRRSTCRYASTRGSFRAGSARLG